MSLSATAFHINQAVCLSLICTNAVGGFVQQVFRIELTNKLIVTRERVAGREETAQPIGKTLRSVVPENLDLEL